MQRIFITGSSDGIGLLAAQSLISKGHSVTLHARSNARAKTLESSCPGASDILIGDLSSLAQTRALAAAANKSGAFDTVIHNAAVGFQEEYRETEDGISQVFAVNALAPYVLTALMEKPRRGVVYVSSSLHFGGEDGAGRDVLEGFEARGGNGMSRMGRKRWSGMEGYRNSKLMNVQLALAISRHWPDVASNALHPGWIKTKLGGSNAPVSVKQGAELPVRLAEGDLEEVGTGGYWSGSAPTEPHPAASDVASQEEFLKICESVSGVKFPK